jgi:hypothetical protein
LKGFLPSDQARETYLESHFRVLQSRKIEEFFVYSQDDDLRGIDKTQYLHKVIAIQIQTVKIVIQLAEANHTDSTDSFKY